MLSADAWTAVKCRSGQERRAAYHVERQGFPFLLLEFRQPANNSFGYRRMLLFPTYLLVLVKRKLDWSCLCNTRGITKVFISDNAPCRIPEPEIQNLLSRRDKDGFIVLDSELLPNPPLRKGDKVRVDKDGHNLFGKTGIFQESSARQRCKVLFRMMGRRVAVEMPEADLVRA